MSPDTLEHMSCACAQAKKKEIEIRIISDNSVRFIYLKYFFFLFLSIEDNIYKATKSCNSRFFKVLSSQKQVSHYYNYCTLRNKKQNLKETNREKERERG